MWTDFNKIQDLQQLVVGTSAVALPAPDSASGVKRPERIFLQALSTNSVSIFIGEADVTSSGSTGGYEMPAGSSMVFPSRIWENFKAIASAANQKLQVSYLAE